MGGHALKPGLVGREPWGRPGSGRACWHWKEDGETRNERQSQKLHCEPEVTFAARCEVIRGERESEPAGLAQRSGVRSPRSATAWPSASLWPSWPRWVEDGRMLLASGWGSQALSGSSSQRSVAASSSMAW